MTHLAIVSCSQLPGIFSATKGPIILSGSWTCCGWWACRSISSQSPSDGLQYISKACETRLDLICWTGRSVDTVVAGLTTQTVPWWYIFILWCLHRYREMLQSRQLPSTGCLPCANGCRRQQGRASLRLAVRRTHTGALAERRPLSTVVADLQLVQQQLQELAELVNTSEQLSSSSSSSESEADAPVASMPGPAVSTPSTVQVAPAASTSSPVAELPSPTAPALAQSGRKVQVCTGKACRKKGSEAMLAALQAQADSQPGLSVVSCKCLDKCKAGPNVQLLESAQLPRMLSGVRPLQYADILGQLAPA